MYQEASWARDSDNTESNLGITKNILNPSVYAVAPTQSTKLSLHQVLPVAASLTV